MATDGRSRESHALEQLTGVRSSKSSYYREYRHTSASLDRSIRALASTSTALTAIGSGAERLVEDFLPAVAETLEADWAALVASHPVFPRSPFQLMATRDGSLNPSPHGDILLLTREGQPPPQWYRAASSGRIRRCAALQWAEDGWGWLAVEMPSRSGAAETDAAILATLAHLVVAAVQSSHLLAEGERLRVAATSAYEEMSAHASRLDETNRQLRQARSALARARENEVVEAERERLARDLHDMVAQRVLAIGMSLELCRDLTADGELRQRIGEAQELARGTVQTIRNAIFELSAADEILPDGLVPSIRALAQQLTTDGPQVSVQSTGAPVRLALAAERALFIVVREALFNVVLHSSATSAIVRVAYRADVVELSITDNGTGDAASLASHLHEALRSRSGYHRGLSFVHGRIRELGGTLEVSAAPGSGVRLTVRVPIEAPSVSR